MIDVGYRTCTTNRVSYIGTLGYELIVPSESARGVYDDLAREAGRGADAGYYAIESARVEKGFRAWGHELGPDVTPIEAGLMFAVAWDKPGGFIGLEALMRAR